MAFWVFQTSLVNYILEELTVFSVTQMFFFNMQEAKLGLIIN